MSDTLSKIDYLNSTGYGACDCPGAFKAFENWQLNTACCGITSAASIFTGGFGQTMGSFAGTSVSNKAFYEISSFGNFSSAPYYSNYSSGFNWY